MAGVSVLEQDSVPFLTSKTIIPYILALRVAEAIGCIEATFICSV